MDNMITKKEDTDGKSYVVSVSYEAPDGVNNRVTSLRQFAFDTKQEATKELDKIKKSGWLTLPTPVGEISLKVFTVELIDIKAYDKEAEKMRAVIDEKTKDE